DHEQEEVDPGGPGHHGPHEALVTRHVHHRQALAVRELERRVAEVDRDPTSALLGQAVGVLPGQRFYEPGLSVVDVPCRTDRQRHQLRARSIAAATSSASASVSVLQSSNVLPSRTSATTGGWPSRSRPASSSSTAQAALGSSVSGSAPPPTRAT